MTVRPINPATLEPLETVESTTIEQLDVAASRAEAALAGPWPVDARRRARVLLDWASVLEAHTGKIVHALVTETGKPISEAHVEVRASLDALRYNAGLAAHLGGHAGTLPDGTVSHLVREPVGVTTFIVPWNWPLLLLLRDLAPAFAAGVTALVKPAPQTTLVTDLVLSLGFQAGLPTDVAHLIVGHADVGQVAVEHPLVRAVAFTGSSTTGAEILRACATGFKRPLLEMGGKGAVVICADADVDLAVGAAVQAAVITSGQMCMACTRILVDRSLYQAVLVKVRAELETLRVGDPADPRTQLGPLISPAAGERVERYLGRSCRLPGFAGYFMRPVVVTDVDVDSPLVQEELFGPVMTVEPFIDEADAVQLANATRFGLATGVWTRDIGRAWRLAQAIQAGTVWVNGYNHSYPEVPSGGFKSSGLGRTRGVAGVEQFTELKHVHFSAE